MTELGVDLFDSKFRADLESVFWQHAQVRLRAGVDVIVESGIWLRADRDEKRLGARALGELHCLAASVNELVEGLSGCWGAVRRHERWARHRGSRLNRAERMAVASIDVVFDLPADVRGVEM